MKINKVLLGLFAGVMALVGGNASAQDTNFVEIGPVNVGGHVTCLVADRNDATTIYAGSATGGLFVRSDKQQTLNDVYTYRGMSTSLAANRDLWHYVPYFEDGKEVILPISSMVQLADNSIVIGTGSDEFSVGSTFAPMSAVGRGIFVFNTNMFGYSVIPGTEPASWNSDWASVRKVDFVEDANGDVHLFAVAKNNIYRINRIGGAWQAPELVFSGANGSIDQFIIVRSLRMAYFTVGNELYKIGNLNATASAMQASTVRVMNADYTLGGENSALKIAVAPSDPSYLYLMVINSNGIMKGLYLTRDLQTWQILTTSTVRVFSMSAVNGKPVVNGDGRHSGTIYVDPRDPQHVVIAGSTIWSGRSYVPGSYYQWTMMSYCEQELNYGDYMASVFGNPSYVHSGIHHILCAPREIYGEMRYVYYIATDGGVFRTYNEFRSYEDLNRGLNVMQTNGVAVSPDGTVVSGAHNGACPLIEARTDHDGGQPEVEWYDDGTHGNINHDALITWKDNGGMVAASMFQQYAPTLRRTIFVSSRDNQFGRSYADYMNYTQTQTWTIGERFLSNSMISGQQVSFMSFWETANDNIFNDSITVTIDTLGYVRRDTTGTGRLDTIWMRNGKFQIESGDVMTVTSRAQAYYPIDYTFTKAMTAGDGNGHANTLKLKNPMQSRMLIIGSDATRKSMWTVWLSWRATDFSKVWDVDASRETWQEWAGIYYVDTTISGNKNRIPRLAVMSADGRMAYIAVEDRGEHTTMIVRVKGFDNVNFGGDSKTTWEQISCSQYSNRSRLSFDTLKVNNSVWLPRAVSSLVADNSLGTERLIMTFEDYSTNFANVATLDNAQGDWTGNQTLTQMEITGHKELPAYCAFVEDSTGNIYVGTADGVWINENNAWHQYEHLRGIAVPTMMQQKANLPARRHIGHNGINAEYYLYPKTKWPGAIYFGTYGRGIFMDMTYVTDRSNAILDEGDYTFGIPTVKGNSNTSVSIFPNPVVGEANLSISATEAGDAQLRIYDLNGRCVSVRNLGHVAEGEQVYSISTEGMAKGMYLVNVIMGGHTSATKMMVR